MDHVKVVISIVVLIILYASYRTVFRVGCNDHATLFLNAGHMLSRLYHSCKWRNVPNVLLSNDTQQGHVAKSTVYKWSARSM